MLVARIRSALRGHVAHLDVVVIDDDSAARRWGMTGSPTLLVDGVDPFAQAGAEASVSCRLLGMPSVAELEAVIGATGRRPTERHGPGVDVLGRGGRGRLAPTERGLRAVQRAALQAVAVSGSPPGAAALDRAAAPFGRVGAEVLRDLAAEDFVTLDDGGHLRAVYPFSIRASRHRVRIDGGPQVWAMCAVDALGIAPMLGRAVTIDTTDPTSADPITVRVSGTGSAEGPPGLLVILGGRDDDGPAEEICCDSINFFSSRHSAGRWAAQHSDIRVEMLDLAAAAELGRAVFADLLGEMGRT
ncbi:MAG: alkylmercury lyase family protein [Sporichthyaceae bacterium]